MNNPDSLEIMHSLSGLALRIREENTALKKRLNHATNTLNMIEQALDDAKVLPGHHVMNRINELIHRSK